MRRRDRRRGAHPRWWALLAAGVVAAGSLTLLATSPASASGPALSSASPVDVVAARKKKGKKTKLGPALAVTPTAPIAGEPVTFTGGLGSAGARSVVLQRQQGGGWATVASGRSTAAGAFALTTAAPGGSSVHRVVAPKAKVGRKKRKAVTTQTAALTGIGQAASLVLSSTKEFVNKEFTATARFAPARAGRPVAIQQLTGSGWVTVVATAQDAAGGATGVLASTTPGTLQFRAVTVAAGGAGEQATPVTSVVVEPDPVQVSDDAEVLSPDEQRAIAAFDAQTGALTFGPDAPASVSQIKVGDVVPIPPRPGADSGALQRVVSVATSNGSTVLQTQPASLPDVVTNVPDDATDIAMYATSAPVVTDVADGVTIEEAGTGSGNRRGAFASDGITTRREAARAGVAAVSIDGDPMEASVKKTLTAGPAKLEVSGGISATPTVDLELDLDWGKVMAYKAGAGVKTVETIQATASIGDDASWSKDLFTVQVTRGGFIGPVPVWATATGTVRLEASMSGEIKTVVSWERTGRYMAGVRSTARGNLAPKAYESRATGSGKVAEVTAAGKIRGAIVGDAQLDLYSLVGPYAELGYEAVAEIAATSDLDGTSYSCSAYHRPIGAAGLKTGAMLEKYVGFSATLAEVVFDFPKNVIGECPPAEGSDPDPEPGPDPEPDPGGSDQMTWRSVSSASFASCGITADGSGWCWGRNEFGQVGDGTNTDQSTPVRLDGTWSSLATDYGTTCGIRSDGSGWCWGRNDHGQVGDGTLTARSRPVRLPGTWRSLRTSDDNTCGIQVDDSGWCWGYDNYGQTGDGTTSEQQPTPVRLPGSWRSLTHSGYTMCGVQTDSSGWCWGYNAHGQTGTGTSLVSIATPRQLTGSWNALTTTDATSCGIQTDDTAWCWGNNSRGQVGDGTTENRTAPRALPGRWRSLSVAYSGPCGIQVDDSGWCWGPNDHGQVGDGSTTMRTTPVRIHGSWLSISADAGTSCGLQTDRTGWCWGDNSHGQLGIGGTADTSLPSFVHATWLAIQVQDGTTCGVRSGGQGACWGVNSAGQVGDGTTRDADLPSPIASGR